MRLSSPILPELRGDFIESIKSFRRTDSILLTGDEHQALINNQKQLEETISFYEQTLQGCEGAVKAASDYIRKYNEHAENITK